MLIWAILYEEPSDSLDQIVTMVRLRGFAILSRRLGPRDNFVFSADSWLLLRFIACLARPVLIVLSIPFSMTVREFSRTVIIWYGRDDQGNCLLYDDAVTLSVRIATKARGGLVTQRNWLNRTSDTFPITWFLQRSRASDIDQSTSTV